MGRSGEGGTVELVFDVGVDFVFAIALSVLPSPLLPVSLSPRLAVPVSALFPLIERISPLAVKVAQVLGLNEIEACGIDARQ